MKSVYLDQNAWIYLAHEYYHKDNSRGLSDTLKAVLEASESGKVIFPISIVHHEETAKNRHEIRRTKLFEFMIKVCKGYTIVPYVSVMEAEIRNVILSRLGRSPVYFDVIRKGAPYMLSTGYYLKSNIPLPAWLYKELTRATESPETLLMLLKNTNSSKYFRKKADRELKLLAEKLEAARIESKKIPEKHRYGVELYKVFRDTLNVPIVKTLAELQVSVRPQALGLNGRAGLENFLGDIPTLYVVFTLMYRRNLLMDRKIQKNDFNDVNALAISIPYCDVVITDKFWASVAVQAKMDKKFQTVILPSVNRLEEHFK